MSNRTSISANNVSTEMSVRANETDGMSWCPGMDLLCEYPVFSKLMSHDPSETASPRIISLDEPSIAMPNWYRVCRRYISQLAIPFPCSGSQSGAKTTTPPKSSTNGLEIHLPNGAGG